MPEGGYSLLDFGDRERLEQWGPYRLVRPDPTAVSFRHASGEWSADAVYRGEKGKGEWETRTPLPDHWPVSFGDLSLHVRLAPYKHTGVFPEQRENWDWARGKARSAGRPLRILNLFAYTGGATVALAKDGHFVTHVDAARPSIGWAKENAVLNDIPSDRIRWMLEDAAVFAAKEVKRGKTYDGIILDPPAYGHGPTGKTWRVERDLAPLLEHCASLLSPDASFIVLNGYAQHDTPEDFRRLLSAVLLKKGIKPHVEASALCLRCADGRQLDTGIVARATFSRAGSAPR